MSQYRARSTFFTSRAGASDRTSWAIGALASLGAGVILAVLESRHLGWQLMIGTLVAVLGVLAWTLKLVDAKFEKRAPSSAQQVACLARLDIAVHILSERLGIDDTYLNPKLTVLHPLELSQAISHDRPISKEPVIDSLSFIAQAVESPRCTVILGVPGSGKTTLLLRLSQRLLDERSSTGSGLIPLFLELRDWSSQYHTLNRWVMSRAADVYGCPEAVSDYWIRTGQVLLALDGLDEVRRDLRSNLLQAIGSWAESAEGTRVVLTAQSSPRYHQDLTQWLKADQIGVLQPFSREDVDIKLEDLLARLSDSTGIRNLSGMRDLFDNVISTSAAEATGGPTLVGLLAESVRETETRSDTLSIDRRDSAEATFALGNEYLRRGDFRAARDAYQLTVHFAESRWSAPASILKATCLFALGDREGAREAMTDSLAMRIQQSMRLGVEFTRDVHLSAEEHAILQAMSEGVSYDLVQVSSSANLPTRRSRPALQSLREKGFVETADNSGENARFKLSPVISAKS